MKRQIIIVNHGLRKKILRAGMGTYPTIKKALEYKDDPATEQCDKIRHYALHNGGVIVESINQ